MLTCLSGDVTMKKVIHIVPVMLKTYFSYRHRPYKVDPTSQLPDNMLEARQRKTANVLF